MAFTIQRLIIVRSPFENKNISKSIARYIVFSIAIASLLSCVWVPFVFKLEQHDCEVSSLWTLPYIYATAAYIFIIILIPIVVIFVCNMIIIAYLNKAKLRRDNLNETTIPRCHQSCSNTNNITKTSVTTQSRVKKTLEIKIKPHYISRQQIANGRGNHAKTDGNTSRTPIVILLVFIILNLPYLVVWCLFFYQVNFLKNNNPALFAALAICEIFYTANYSILFFVYCLTGSKFRQRLRYSGKWCFNLTN